MQEAISVTTTVTVSDKGQVVIPAEIRHRPGITPGCQLDFTLEGNVIRAEVRRRVDRTRVDEGFGMLVCRSLENVGLHIEFWRNLRWFSYP